MKRKHTTLAVSILLLLSLLMMSSCELVMDPTMYMTREETEKLIGDSMMGDITVEAGDNYNVTVNNTVGENQPMAGKALLSAVSIDSSFPSSSYDKPKVLSGSGVIYKFDKEHGDAYIITNYHVVYYASSALEDHISRNISVYLYGMEGAQYAIPATFVGGSMTYDIAILKIEGNRTLAKSNAAAASLADSNSVAVLDKVFAIGNPGDLGLTATLGYVGVDSEYIKLDAADDVTTIQIRVMRFDADINGGNSGGGLFDTSGELVGIVTAQHKTNNGMGYAIPSNFVKCVAESILYYCDGKTAKTISRCYLGITVSAYEMYTEYDKDTGGLLKREVIGIADIEEGSLASGALKIDDIINSITVDGVKYDVTRMYIVTDAMINARVGSSVTVNITRGNEVMDVEITITEASVKEIA